jgi:hypothetical protein
MISIRLADDPASEQLRFSKKSVTCLDIIAIRSTDDPPTVLLGNLQIL